jgi:glutamine cyclotransferase
LKTNSARVGVSPKVRWDRALGWLLVFVAVTSVLSCGTPETGSLGAAATKTTSPQATPTSGAETVEASPGPEATKVPRTAASPMATSTSSITPAPTAATTPTVPSTSTAASTSTATPVLLTATPLSATAPATGPSEQGNPVYTYRIVNIYPHDREAFTQGLVFEDGVLYEGTGLWGASTLRRVDLKTGDVMQLHPLPPEYFGEGITIFGDRIIQLTWKARLGFVYDKDSFELLGTFRYPTEGWGMTHDGTALIMSDGSSTLRFLDPDTFEEIGQIQVFDDQGPVSMLNELEYVQGKVYANVWQTDLVAVIEPGTGQVSAWIDLQGLLEAEDYLQPVDVLNGIAYDADGERLFVTGKWWPKLFEIELLRSR